MKLPSPNILKNRKRTAAITLTAMIAMIFFAVSIFIFSNKIDDKSITQPKESYSIPDTLRIGVLNSPTTYFIYRTTPMGYDYELVNAMADSLNIKVKLSPVTNFPDLLSMLKNGEIDMIASPVPVTAEFREVVEFCGPTEQTTQVLVQKKNPDMAKDVTDLVGRHITVEQESKFDYRLQNLNSELGGGIAVERIRKDTLVSEDMIRMVSDRDIEMTVVDSDIAALNIPDYPDLDASLSISLEQNSQWAVKKGNSEMGRLIDQWIEAHPDLRKQLRDKYFHSNRHPEGLYISSEDLDEIFAAVYDGKGNISSYDHLFKSAAQGTSFDWQLLAAVAYVESRFKTDLVSWAGARGIMQVMPGTARAMGFSPERMNEPQQCIAAGTKILVTLDEALSKKIPDRNQRLDFILAAYNAGLGHISDAIALAEKYGMNAKKWSGGVEQAAIMKSRPEYYRDPVVKNGYFRAKETVDFVRQVKSTYSNFRKGGANT
ncbi:MAG: transporter substrate-binding domain-containing protein [Bacteroides sp.]|nr:transporter substrate-binding domain-containing protein [Bacteroides sp.]